MKKIIVGKERDIKMFECDLCGEVDCSCDEIKTYKEMNEKIKDLLRLGDDPTCLYAAARIEELEEEVMRLTVANINLNQERLSEIH